MAPKVRIRKKQPPKSRRVLSSKKVHKEKLKKALTEKSTQRESSSKRASPHRASPSRNRKCAEKAANAGIPRLPARGPGRSNRFDESEESFLRNVPDQLKQYAFKPGHAPTPGAGRPRGSFSLTARLRGILATPIEGREKKRGQPAVTYADELMALAVQAARRGDYRFFQHIYERMDGKIPDHVVVEEVQQIVAQESEKVTEDVLKIVGDVVLEELGEKRAAVLREKLGARLSEKLGEKDAGRRAG